MIRIAIAEDEKEYSGQLIAYLNQYADEKHLDFDIHLFSDGLDLVEEFRLEWDIIFLDIRMKHMDGMRAAHKIREKDQEVILIFITSMAQYSIKGYEVDASDFILKPVAYPHLCMRLDKALRKLNKDTGAYLIVNENGIRQKVAIAEIMYAEVQNHYIDLVLKDRTITIRKTMAELEEELSEGSFSRCSNSYLVNLKHVASYQKDTVTVKGRKLPVTRTRKKQFMTDLLKYLGE